MHRTPTPDQAHYSGLADAQTADLCRYLDLHAGLNGPLPHLEAHGRRAQRDRHEQIATAYAALVRDAVPTFGDEILDEYRRSAEWYGSRTIVGDLTGDELARLCDEELAGRHVSIPHIDADARARAARNDLIAGLDRLISNVSLVVAAVAAIIGLGAAAQVVTLFVGGAL